MGKYNFQEADYKVYQTKDYSVFVHLKENREVKEQRVKKIRKSIDSVGYIRNPIIVNEKMEIIDGQGRFEVLKEKGYPIEFVIDEGIGVDECRAMNQDQTNWSVKDYVNSYCQSGNKNYMNLKELADRHGEFNLATIYSISNSKFSCGGGGDNGKVLKSGKADFSREKFEEAKETLDYVSRFIHIANRIGGSRSLFYCIIGFIYQNKLCDSERLYDVLNKCGNKVSPVAATKETMTQISDVYNYKLGFERRVYFQIEWEKIYEKRKRNNLKNVNTDKK